MFNLIIKLDKHIVLIKCIQNKPRPIAKTLVLVCGVLSECEHKYIYMLGCIVGMYLQHFVLVQSDTLTF